MHITLPRMPPYLPLPYLDGDRFRDNALQQGLVGKPSQGHWLRGRVVSPGGRIPKTPLQLRDCVARHSKHVSPVSSWCGWNTPTPALRWQAQQVVHVVV